jgi:hypothetical protein
MGSPIITKQQNIWIHKGTLRRSSTGFNTFETLKKAHTKCTIQEMAFLQSNSKEIDLNVAPIVKITVH